MGFVEEKFGGIFVVDDWLYCCALQKFSFAYSLYYVFIVNVSIYL